MRKSWSLYNKIDKLRIDDLSTEQVKIILLAIPTRRMGDWFTCQEGDVHWQPLAAIPEFYDQANEIKGLTTSLKAVASDPPPATRPTRRRPLFEEATDEAQTATIELDTSAARERRSGRRYSRQLGIRIQHGNQTFKTRTRDISMTGFSLEDALPQGLPKEFKAKLILDDTEVAVACSKVDDQHVRMTKAESWEIIRKWIMNG